MLEIRNLSIAFAGNADERTLALNNINLRLAPGCFAVIIGTNGSGKSTLLNAVAGTLAPDAGKIFIKNNDVSSWPEHRRAALIGRVFQNPFSGTAAHLTVAENLALAADRGLTRGLGLAVNSKRRREFSERLRELNLGLENRLDSEIGVLSGGQRQAITLLMATWRRPELLLLDEHTAALDPKTAEQVALLTQSIVEAMGLTALMVTHSMQQAVNLGSRLLMLHRGQIVLDAEGPEKKLLRVDSLLGKFQELRRADRLDEPAAEFLRANYV